MIEATDVHKIMIHEELASKNQLNLGDTITLDVIQQETGEKKKVDYEIVGIFSSPVTTEWFSNLAIVW